MQSVGGIFTDREAAKRATHELRAPEVAGERVSMLAPGTSHADVVAEVPTTEGEAPRDRARTRRRRGRRGRSGQEETTS